MNENANEQKRLVFIVIIIILKEIAIEIKVNELVCIDFGQAWDGCHSIALCVFLYLSFWTDIFQRKSGLKWCHKERSLWKLKSMIFCLGGNKIESKSQHISKEERRKRSHISRYLVFLVNLNGFSFTIIDSVSLSLPSSASQNRKKQKNKTDGSRSVFQIKKDHTMYRVADRETFQTKPSTTIDCILCCVYLFELE